MKSVAAFMVLALIWAAGLFAFASRVQQSTPAPDPQPADGIVALTGGNSIGRISAAMDLLEQGMGKRLLISGVNRDVSREDIRSISKAARRLYDCCVDLGFTAADTVGNARETADWARAMRYRDLIIVTADYHMPRAMLELRAVMREPEFHLQAYPSATPSLKARHWWRSRRSARLMVVEYCKYLAILGREAVLGLGPREPVEEPAQQPSPQKDAP
jgi:uncharacterized SAM-binding protein YcdF (DUF218 family)